MIKAKLLSLLLVAAMFTSATAVAAGEKLADKLSHGTLIVNIEITGCQADENLLCPGLQHNSRKSFMCLMAYEDHLSSSCALGIVEAAMTLEAGLMAIDHSIKSCEADADKFCLDVEPGNGRIVQCLVKNEANLAEQCVSALKETGMWEMGVQ